MAFTPQDVFERLDPAMQAQIAGLPPAQRNFIIAVVEAAIPIADALREEYRIGLSNYHNLVRFRDTLAENHAAANADKIAALDTAIADLLAAFGNGE